MLQTFIYGTPAVDSEKDCCQAIHRRGLMFVLFLFLAIVGYYSWSRLAIDAYPDIADTTVQVVTQVPGLAAEEIEQQISIPIERAMNGLPGLNVMRSKNTFGLSTVVLVFDDGIEGLLGPATCTRAVGRQWSFLIMRFPA